LPTVSGGIAVVWAQSSNRAAASLDSNYIERQSNIRRTLAEQFRSEFANLLVRSVVETKKVKIDKKVMARIDNNGDA
jgi:hypothetical protein